MNTKSPSEEQDTIIQYAKNGNNIIINANPGSGKTTTCLFIKNSDPTIKNLLLTYGKKLKEDSRRKIKSDPIQNLEVQNYHAMWKHYYDDNINDKNIADRLKDPMLHPKKPIRFDRICIDECQDMKPLFYNLICKILTDNEIKNPQLIIVGDFRQTIFGYMGADCRFLTLGHMLYNRFSQREWEFAILSVTYRLTKPTVDFINHVILKSDGTLVAHKDGACKPDYVIANLTDRDKKTDRINKSIISYIEELLTHEYKIDDIAILAYSVKSQLVKDISNMLSSMDIPVHTARSEDEVLSDNICKNKIVLSTFHQFKGLERKVIIVLGFDASMYKFYLKNADTTLCPNILFVGATRSEDKVRFIHNAEHDYLPFLDIAKIQEHANVIEYDTVKTTGSYAPAKLMVHKISVSDLISHIPAELEHELISMVQWDLINPAGSFIDINTSSKQNNELVESVSDITGVAIPAFYQFKRTGKCSILNTMRNYTPEKLGFVIPSDTEFRNLDIQAQLRCVLQIATAWISVVNDLDYVQTQITRFNWISTDELNACMDRMDKLGLLDTGRYEYKEAVCNKTELQGKSLIGYFDYIDEQQAHEFKVTREFKNSHALQQAGYMYMNETLKFINLAIEMHNADDNIAEYSLAKGAIQLNDNICFNAYEINRLDRPRSISLQDIYRIGRVVDIAYDYIIIQDGDNQYTAPFTDLNPIDDVYLLNLSYLARTHPDKIPRCRYYLDYILTGEVFELKAEYDQLVQIIDKLIKHQKREIPVKSDAEFLDECMKSITIAC